MPISNQLKRAQEHAEGVMVLEGDAGDTNSPAYEGISYRAQIDDVRTVRTVYGGTKTMREAKEAVLPKYPEESDDDYGRRVARAVLFNAFKRTVGGLNGMIFRKAPIVDEATPDVIEADLDNVDLAGRSLPVFMQDAGENAMIDGHTWVHVDHPKGPQGRQLTREQARAQFGDQRPYWIEVTKSQAINVQWEKVDGRPVLRLFAYTTTATVADGRFGEKTVEQIRVLTPGAFELWEKMEGDDGNERWSMVDHGTTSIDEVPVVFMPSNRMTSEGPYYSEPPLLDLAYENIDHYQVRSDHRYAALWAANPMPYATGVDSEAVVWGPNRFLFLEEPQAKVGVLETSGEGANVTRETLKDIEAHMAALGLQMLVRETRAAETAEAKQLDKSESDSALSQVAQAYEDAANEALRIHAEYRNAEAGTVTLNRDFQAQEIDAARLRELREMVAAGQMSLDTFWEILKEGELLDADFDPDEERERIEADFVPMPVPVLPGIEE